MNISRPNNNTGGLKHAYAGFQLLPMTRFNDGFLSTYVLVAPAFPISFSTHNAIHVPLHYNHQLYHGHYVIKPHHVVFNSARNNPQPTCQTLENTTALIYRYARTLVILSQSRWIVRQHNRFRKTADNATHYICFTSLHLLHKKICLIIPPPLAIILLIKWLLLFDHYNIVLRFELDKWQV